ncbi:TPA: glucosyltransferase domain-containing protein [Escherichia coli]|nr:glucosyltransferase domain-containing protein [Escherichia coli]
MAGKTSIRFNLESPIFRRSRTTLRTIDDYIIYFYIGFSVNLFYQKTNHLFHDAGPFVYILLVISPFYTQNISYQYDGITMSIAVACALIATIVTLKENLISYLVHCALLVIAMSIYQTTLNMFAILSLAIIFAKTCTHKALPLKYLACIASSFVLALILYKFLIIDVFISSSRSDISLDNLHTNFINFSSIIASPFRGYLVSIFYCIVALSFYSLIRKRGVLIGVTFLFFCVMAFCLIAGPFILLKEGIAEPRMLLGFSPFIFLCLYPLRGRISTVSSVIVFSVFTIISYQCASSIKTQNDYEKSLAMQSSQEIINAVKEKSSKVYIQGEFPLSKISKNSAADNEFINKMIAPSPWYTRMLINIYYPGTVHIDWKGKYLSSHELEKCNVLKSNILLTIYNCNNITYVEIHK